MTRDQLRAAAAAGCRIQAWRLLPGATSADQGQWETLTDPQFTCPAHLYRVHQARPDGGEARLTALRAAQAEAVMPLIGPLLDAWEGACNDDKEVMREAGVAERIEAINEMMENHPDPVPTPAPDAADAAWRKWASNLRAAIGNQTEVLRLSADVQADAAGVRFGDVRLSEPGETGVPEVRR